MSERHEDAPDNRRNEFVRQARGRSSGPLREYFDLIRTTKKYWLAPMILVLLLLAAVILLSGSAMAPMHYAIF